MARVIMVQGTMSNAGKSLLVAALCRILKQDGYKVAPFKSQNMALNSFITKEGLEMGRAQVTQAEAAGIEPSVLMNPILLKPTNDTGSQVIVNGRVLANMSARDYFAMKKKLIPDIMEAYQKLAEEYDIIVIEGAGSPAEINLKQDDIVNMGLAELVDAPVLLVADIDRGGVFAQLYGTVMLLEEQERNRIKGLVINKFRGDKTILDPGIQMIEEKTGIDVVGVLPFMHVQIEDEDSLSERLRVKRPVGKASGTSAVAPDTKQAGAIQTGATQTEAKQAGAIQAEAIPTEACRQIPAMIDIAVIRYPRISNFTDCNVFDMIESVRVRYVTSPEELGVPDMVILPGSKNTMKDLLWMRQNGLEAAIKKLASSGQERQCVVFGICGGYQMLGSWIHDPEETEAGGSIQGMNLLPVETIFQEGKTRTRVSGHVTNVSGPLKNLSGVAIEGYEIHMGNTTFFQEDGEGDGSLTAQPCHLSNLVNVLTGEEKADGCHHENVYGTYVHGFFDAEEVAYRTAQALAMQKGMTLEQTLNQSYEAFKETQYDLLADTVRQYMDMDRIYEILKVK